MAWNDFRDMIIDVCKDIGVERAAVITQITQKLAVEAELDVLTSADPSKIAMQRAIEQDRASYRQIASRWAAKVDVALAYAGTQLTVPSRYSVGGRVTDRRLLIDDISAYMKTNSLFVVPRATTWAAEPAIDDNGIIDRLTVDRHAEKIEGGLPTTIDAEGWSRPSQYRSILRVKPRNGGIDVFNLVGPTGFLDIEAVNGAGGQNLVTNGQLVNTNSTTNAAAVTSMGGWTLSDQSGVPVHVIDTSILYRGASFSHKMYGANTTARRMVQPLVVAPADRNTPRNYMLAVYKTGTPTGNITIAWGGKTQVFAMGSLSSGWNYLRLDRDADLWPRVFASAGAVLQVDVVFATGSDASNYINIGFMGGQNLRRYNAAWWGHWSQTGISTEGVSKAFADSTSAAGVNASALTYAYYGTPDYDFAYLPSSGMVTIADYT